MIILNNKIFGCFFEIFQKNFQTADNQLFDFSEYQKSFPKRKYGIS